MRLLARKKIIFVIVEGASDDEALGVIFSRLYDKQSVHIEITHGDITSKTSNNPSNIVSKVGDLIKKYAKANHYDKTDFLEIIHIMDTDGAYIHDKYVTKDTALSGKAIYSLTHIKTQDPDTIRNRNSNKSKNMDRLQSQKLILQSKRTSCSGIPYYAYYMSCNLDHVLYNKLNSTDIEKENDAFKFTQKYKDDLDGFLSFICDSNFSVCNDYKESWKFIRKDLNSLNRYSNLGICFAEIRKERIDCIN